MPTLATAPLVGKGFCSDVYAWGEGRVLKLPHGWVPPARAEREYAATVAVRAAGLPVPAAFGLIEVEGRCGIVFERIEGVSLLGYTRTRPWAVFYAIRLLADLHARVHRCDGPAGLPLQRERIAERIGAAADLPEADRRAALRRLAALPDGTALCHGDFHPDNVLITPRGPVIIDWSSASRGRPLGDVAQTSRLMRTAGLPPWSPGYMHVLLKCLRPTMHRVYLKHYFRARPGPRREIEDWRLPLAAAGRSWRGRLPGNIAGDDR